MCFQFQLAPLHLGTSFCDRYSTAVGNADAYTHDPAEAAAHARILPAEQAESFLASLLVTLPLLAAAAPDPTAHLAMVVFPAAQGDVVAALAHSPLLQFQYLRGVVAGAGAASSAATAPSGAASSSIATVSADAAVSSVAAASSGPVIIEDMTELYVRLLCEFEPRSVKAFLEDSPCGRGLHSSTVSINLRRFWSIKYGNPHSVSLIKCLR
jgi:hypothetical protein